MFVLVHRVEKHPECQYCGTSMEQIPAYVTLAPSLAFFTEHARHHAEYSGKLEYEEENSSYPPSHIVVPP
jgi:hypothetical protein